MCDNKLLEDLQKIKDVSEPSVRHKLNCLPVFAVYFCVRLCETTHCM